MLEIVNNAPIILESSNRSRGYFPLRRGFGEVLIRTLSAKVVLSAMALTIFLSSCSEEEPSLTASFFKIYDDSNFDLNYDPIDVVEINDGFILLTGTEQENSDFDGIQLIRIDEEGNFVTSEENAFSDYEAAIGDMFFDVSDSSMYFFAKNAATTDAVLIQVDPSLAVQNATLLGGINYPLSASSTSSSTLLIQSYDPVNLQTEISEISLSGGFIGGNQYSIGPGEDVEEDVINHFLETNVNPYPFFCGEVSTGNYYFNGFYNYSFSLVFTDFSSAEAVSGQGINAGIRAVLPLEGGNFAVAGFQFDDNYQLSSNPLPRPSNVGDLYPGNMAELRPYTTTKIFSYTTTSAAYTVFAAETKGNQIVLHFYNGSTGEIEGVHYIGYLNRFNLGSVKVTEDESILILGTTFVAGRFERIFLNKISQTEIGGILN